MSEKKIFCKGKAERDAVLKKLEEQGVRWAGGHESPTEWESDKWGENSEIVFIISFGLLSWGHAGFYKSEGEKLIPAKEYLRQFKTKPILISRTYNLVTAMDKNTGSVRTALCSDNDTFNFYDGAMIALCRLVDGHIGEDAKAEMRKVLGEEKKPEEDDIKVGDEVIVVNNLYSHSLYASWFSENNINMDITARFAYGKKLNEGTHYFVKAIGPHRVSRYGTVYCIQERLYDTGINSAYLIGREGIEKV